MVDGGRSNGPQRHTRATVLAVLLIPAVVVSGFSMWFFTATWIGVAVLLVGLVIAALGSVRPLTTSAIAQVLVVEVGLLVSTAVVGFAIDCARSCS